MKYPVLLESFHENESKIVCATDIVDVFQDAENEGVTCVHLFNKPTELDLHILKTSPFVCKHPINEVYQKIQDALNPGSNSEALKQQNSQLIQVIDSTKAKLEAYKGEIEDIRELIEATEDESAFDKVKSIITDNQKEIAEKESQFKGLADGMKDFMQWTIQYIPKDLHPQVEKTINDLKEACNSKS